VRVSWASIRSTPIVTCAITASASSPVASASSSAGGKHGGGPRCEQPGVDGGVGGADDGRREQTCWYGEHSDDRGEQRAAAQNNALVGVQRPLSDGYLLWHERILIMVPSGRAA